MHRGGTPFFASRRKKSAAYVMHVSVIVLSREPETQNTERKKERKTRARTDIN